MGRDLLPLRRPPARLERRRERLRDGAGTTLHVARYAIDLWTPRLVELERPAPLVRWCAEQGVAHAVVGGFFVRADYVPLGVLRIGGAARRSIPFDPPWGEVRACVQIDSGRVRIAPRLALGVAPGDDVLQAGPLLVYDGRSAIVEGEDREGFSAASHQFDSDITLGRYPRAALGVAGDHLLAVACDGRTRGDAGMTLGELADAMIDLGATEALNLDGGGSASLVYEGRLRNRPREPHGIDLLDGRPIVTAIVFESP